MIRNSSFALPVALLVAACSSADGGRDAVSGTDTAPDVAADTAPDVAADTAPDVVADVAPDVAADTAPDVVADTAPDVAADVAPDVAADTAPDVVADTAPYVVADVAPDVAADVAPDVVADVAPDVVADVAPDVVADVAPDVVADAGPCASLPDGSVLSANFWGPCGDFEDACRVLGTREREIVVCRAGEATVETEVGGCADTVPAPLCEEGILTRRVDGLPRIHDYSGAPAEVVDALVQRALDGLGLDTATGPSERDRVFVGRWFIVWLDETGFYGKANGLWALNGDLEALDFVLTERGRPVNAFIVGENGAGRWPGGYMGAEHIEFPNNVPEPDDDPRCAESLCAQYSLNEAHQYTDPDIPTWRACNAGSPSFDEHFAPLSIVPVAGGFDILYEGRLTKQGDFGGSTSGANCHADFLFPDNVRRPVYLRVGYALRADNSTLDRLHQVRNPAANPVFDGPFGFIGGFVMSAWPNPHPLKQLHRYIRVPEREVRFDWEGETVVVPPDTWFAFPETPTTRDVVLGWAGQPVTLASRPQIAAGEGYTLSNVGETDNDDTGFCMCFVHGGIEQGGALVHDPVASGAKSPVAVRRLEVHTGAGTVSQQVLRFDPVRGLSHATGYPDADGWAANTVDNTAAHMAYGPYTRELRDARYEARFELMVDVVNDSAERVLTLDIYDAATGEVLAQRDLQRREFLLPLTYRVFVLDFDMRGRAGNPIETRVYWHDNSYVRLGGIDILER